MEMRHRKKHPRTDSAFCVTVAFPVLLLMCSLLKLYIYNVDFKNVFLLEGLLGEICTFNLHHPISQDLPGRD